MVKAKKCCMLKTRVKHCGYGYVEESANDLLEGLKDGERYVDLKITPLSDIMALVTLIYKCEV